MTFRRWFDGTEIGYTKLVPEFRDNFHAPYYVIHRAHFHDALYRRAVELGVRIKVASKVESYNLDAPSVQLTSGEDFHADLVIAADGKFPCTSPLFINGNKLRGEIRCQKGHSRWHRLST